MTRHLAFFNGESVDTSKQTVSKAPTLPSMSLADKRALFVTTIPLTLTSFLIPFATYFQQLGMHVDCAAYEADKAPGLEAFEKRYSIDWDRSLASFTRLPLITRQLFAAFDAGNYDIVHVHTPIAAYLTRKALHQWKKQHPGARTRLIYTAHGFHFHEGQESPLKGKAFYQMEKRALPWTDALVCMNDEDESAAHALCASASTTICARIDGIGCDFEQYERIRRARHESTKTLDESPVRIIIIAEHNDNKDHALLFEALTLLNSADVTNWRLSVVGQGLLTKELKEKVLAMGLEGQTTFHGQVDASKLITLMGKSDIGVLVSKREGLPRSLMELCACGVCIAGTNTRGIIDEVRDPRAIAFERTPQEVALMLEELIANKALRDALALEQYTYAREHYDLPNILAAYENLYTRVIKART